MVAETKGFYNPCKINDLCGRTEHDARIEIKGLSSDLANAPTSTAFPQKENAAPVGPRNGVECAYQSNRGALYPLYQYLARDFSANSERRGGFPNVDESDVERIARACGNASRSSGGWVCSCPSHEDQKPSLSLKKGDNGRLLVNCHAGCSPEHVRDDLERMGLISGGNDFAPQNHSHTPRPAKPSGDDQGNIRRAREIWDHARPIADQAAMTYLQSARGVDIESLSTSALEGLRHHPVAPRGNGASGPALIAKVTDNAGEFCGVHRIFIEPDGSDKAKGEPSRQALGTVKGGAFWLGDPGAQTVIVTEGVEDALCIAAALGDDPRITVASAISTGGVKSLELAPTTRAVVIAADNDEPGQKAAKAAMERFHMEGRGAVVVDAAAAWGEAKGADPNDALRMYACSDGREIAFDHILEAMERAQTPPATPTPAPADSPADARPINHFLHVQPYECCDPSMIPPREWLYGRRLIRRNVSLTVSPGGVGKSSLTITEALAMVSGRALLNEEPVKPLRVWMWNGEDEVDEMRRRIEAARLHYGLSPDDIGDRLIVCSGREIGFKLAEQTGKGLEINHLVKAHLIEALKAQRIDVLIVDPFCTTHGVSENDNNAINAVASLWREIANEANCAIEIVHHATKTALRPDGASVGIEQARGASSLIDAVRSARYLVRMTEDEAAKAGVDPDKARSYVRVQNGKANLAPPDKSTWFELRGVDLGNGPLGCSDHAPVTVQWMWPDSFDGVDLRDLKEVQDHLDNNECAAHHNAKNWIGHAVGKIVGVSTGEGKSGPEYTSDDKAGRAKVKNLIATWEKNGAIKKEKIGSGKNERSVFVTGEPVSLADISRIANRRI